MRDGDAAPAARQSDARLFRLPQAEALVNRLGFNNDGVERFLANVATRDVARHPGLNIGKNFDTPNARAVDDYLRVPVRRLHARVVRHRQHLVAEHEGTARPAIGRRADRPLCARSRRSSARLPTATASTRRSPSRSRPISRRRRSKASRGSWCEHRIDGVIATNTTIERDSVKGMAHADEAGGLSGRPLRHGRRRSSRALAKALDGALPIIGVGGILSGADAKEKIDAGATLIQIYTGLIYRGPDLVPSARERSPAGRN
jgi:dihydroorotate dehydrogenase